MLIPHDMNGQIIGVLGLGGSGIAAVAALQAAGAHVVAFDDTVSYEIGKVGGMKSFMFGGEGVVMHFSGQGRVWIQTRNLASLAANLIPFWPQSG